MNAQDTLWQRLEELAELAPISAEAYADLRAAAQIVKEAAELRAAVQAAFDAGMIPNSSAKDGGGAKYSAQVRAADMLREAMAKTGGAP